MHTPTDAEVIRGLRETQEPPMTMYALAKAAGVSADAVRLIERGERTPTLETARRLARTLGVSLAVFDASAAPKKNSDKKS